VAWWRLGPGCRYFKVKLDLKGTTKGAAEPEYKKRLTRTKNKT